jgi:hypothetical protein
MDASAFEEIRDDTSFTPFAAGLAAVAIVVAGFGAWLFADTVQSYTPDGWFVDTVILGSLFTALLWLAGVAVMYLVLTQAHAVTVSPDALLRVCAVGFLPYALGVLVFIPEVGFGLALLSVALAYLSTSFGLSSAFGISSARAGITALAGFAVLGLILPLIGEWPDNNYATGIFVYGLAA